MTPADDAPHTPAELETAFGVFRVETEAMPDGRRIHYYSWPAEPDRSAPAYGGGSSPPSPADGASGGV